MKEIRTLRAEEIDCRIAIVKPNGVSLLLYKDARVDMQLLDETFGSENWQRKHELINGNLFCSIGVKCDGEWIWKEDVGVESFTEKEKGQASDSFKRAGVCWGIGRELYTAPFIWVTDCEIKERFDKKGTYTCFDKFEVSHINYDDKRVINELVIVNSKTKKVVYDLSEKSNPLGNIEKAIVENSGEEKLTLVQDKKIQDLLARAELGDKLKDLLVKNYEVDNLGKLTKKQADNFISRLESTIKKKGGK